MDLVLVHPSTRPRRDAACIWFTHPLRRAETRLAPGSPAHPAAPRRGLHRAAAAWVFLSSAYFFWYVPWWLIQSQPFSGFVYSLQGSGLTNPFERETTLNWPSFKISPINTGLCV